MISLLNIIKEVLTPSSEYLKEIEKIKEEGGIFLGSGDYGSVYQVGDVVKKVTSDEVELEHAEILKGKPTKYFVPILDVKVLNSKLGIITMPNMKPSAKEIPEEFLINLKDEAEQLGIDPDELDIRPDNFMLDRKGNLKMTDV
jgi:serine/threonine protein kinase